MGLVSDIIKTFEVYNQPLFAYPDTGDMSYAILYGILHDEDQSVHMKRRMISGMNMGHLRRFNRRLDNEYPYGYPAVETNINVEVTSEIQAIIDSTFGVPMSVGYVHAGNLTDFDWIIYCLSTLYKVQSDFIYFADYSEGCLNSNTVQLPDPRDPVDYIFGTIVGAYYEWGGTPYVRVEYVLGGDTPTTIQQIFEIDVPSKPSGQYYIGSCESCVGLEWMYRIWFYDVDDGTYPDLDLPDMFYGSEVGFTECFPAVPVRIRNVNFNDPASDLDEDEIKKLLRIFGIKPDVMIDEVMSSPEVTDPDQMDNVFSNFGVRVWDESEAGRQYLYTFFSEVLTYFVAAGADENQTECIETLVDVPDDEGATIFAQPCSSITVDTEHTLCKTYFSSIVNTFYTMAEVDASAELSAIYYSDTGKFHSSSGEFLRPAGYTAMRQWEVEAWLNGGGTRSHRQIPPGDDGWDHLKPAVRISDWPGVIYNPDGSVSSTDELIPETVYEKHLGAIKMIAPEPEEDVREITYYAILPTGLDAITVYGIGGQVFVSDTEYPQFSRYVQLKSNNTNQLTVPFMFGIVENIYDDGQMHDKVDALVCSMHMSIYVANVEYVSIPWWMVIVKVIMFIVIIIVAIYCQACLPFFTQLVGTQVAIFEAILYATMMYYIASTIFKILSSINPWLSIASSVIMALYGSYSSGALSLANLSAMTLPQMLSMIMNIMSQAIKVATTFMSEDNKDEFNLIQDSYIEEINELRMLDGGNDYSKYSDTVLNALYGENTVTVIAPIDPEAYFNKVEEFANIGFSLYDVDSFYSENNMMPGMA